MKQTKTRVWSQQATSADWEQLQHDINTLSDPEFKSVYSFTKSGIKPYLQEHLGITPQKEASTLVYTKPSGYVKVSIQISAEAYEAFQKERECLSDQYGFSMQYINSVILEQGIQACQKFHK